MLPDANKLRQRKTTGNLQLRIRVTRYFITLTALSTALSIAWSFCQTFQTAYRVSIPAAFQDAPLLNGMNGTHQHQHKTATNSSLKVKRPNSHSNTSNNSGSSLKQSLGQPPFEMPLTERVGMGLASSPSSASLRQVASSQSC
jgi:hypothetical protein